MSEAPRDTKKIVSLRGEAIRAPYEPDPKLVEGIEKLLEMARSGEINGVAVAIHNSDGTTQSLRMGLMSRGLVGMLEILKLSTCRDVD